MFRKIFAALALLAGMMAVVSGGGCVLGIGGQLIRHPIDSGFAWLAVIIGLIFFTLGAHACKRAWRTLTTPRSDDS